MVREFLRGGSRAFLLELAGRKLNTGLTTVSEPFVPYVQNFHITITPDNGAHNPGHTLSTSTSSSCVSIFYKHGARDRLVC